MFCVCDTIDSIVCAIDTIATVPQLFRCSGRFLKFIYEPLSRNFGLNRSVLAQMKDDILLVIIVSAHHVHNFHTHANCKTAQGEKKIQLLRQNSKQFIFKSLRSGLELFSIAPLQAELFRGA